MGSFEIPNFGGKGRVKWSGCAPIESPPVTFQYLSIQSFAHSAAVWPEFQCQIWPLIRPPICGLGWTQGGRKWYQSKCRPHIPICLYMHHRHILHRLATTHNISDRQSHWNRLPMLQWQPKKYTGAQQNSS